MKDARELHEYSFTGHLLDSITRDGKVIVIVPQSSMTGKTKEERSIKKIFWADSSPKCNAKPPFLARQTPPMAV
ncbi:TPA: hypothetical protein MPK85_005659 [Salmonella enterica]|nr:hypothetical protein [Salmonella enterica]